MSNFDFLEGKKEYALFAPACMEAEKIYTSAPAMCAVGCRKALELAVKWVYSADSTMKMPYKDNSYPRAHFSLCCGLQYLGKAFFYHQIGQSGGAYGT